MWLGKLRVLLKPWLAINCGLGAFIGLALFIFDKSLAKKIRKKNNLDKRIQLPSPSMMVKV